MIYVAPFSLILKSVLRKCSSSLNFIPVYNLSSTYTSSTRFVLFLLVILIVLKLPKSLVNALLIYVDFMYDNTGSGENREIPQAYWILTNPWKTYALA